MCRDATHIASLQSQLLKLQARLCLFPVAIGRPNVGKSTIVNRLAGDQAAIVHDEPGVTRDRTYVPAFWRDRDFLVVDTGGSI